MYHAARTTTCRLCEYQCYVAGNNALHSIAVDSAWWINAACQATIVNNSRSGAQGISTNVALPAGGCCYETMLLPRTSKQGKEKTLKIVAFGPSALRQQFSMSSLSPVLRYVIIIHCDFPFCEVDLHRWQTLKCRRVAVLSILLPLLYRPVSRVCKHVLDNWSHNCLISHIYIFPNELLLSFPFCCRFCIDSSHVSANTCLISSSKCLSTPFKLLISPFK